MLSSLVDGMEKAGAQVEVVNLRTKTVKNCIGCYTCWTKSPGRCVHRDDMAEELFPEVHRGRHRGLRDAAVPLHHERDQSFIERTLPAIEPYLRVKGETTASPPRGRHPAVVKAREGFPRSRCSTSFQPHEVHARKSTSARCRGHGVHPTPGSGMISLDAVQLPVTELVKTMKIPKE